MTGKVLAANYTGQVYMWSDFNFVAPYHFEYEDYPNDQQKICYKFDDKRYFTVRFVVAPEVKDRQREAIGETHVTGWSVVDMEVTVSVGVHFEFFHLVNITVGNLPVFPLRGISDRTLFRTARPFHLKIQTYSE